MSATFSDDIKQFILDRVKEDIKISEDYYNEVVKPTVKERYDIFFADRDRYKKKFPRLSLSSDLVSTDVADTIEWAIPPMMKIFAGDNDIVTILGVNDEDEPAAQIMQDLLSFQLKRRNKFTTILYNWFKDAFITGIGLVKCYWEREEMQQTMREAMHISRLQQMQQNNIEIISVGEPDQWGNVMVEYKTTYYTKNSPKLENILISEFLYSPDARTLDDCAFIAHRKKVNYSYLKQKEKDGIYANVDLLSAPNTYSSYSIVEDEVERTVRGDYYYRDNSVDEARQKYILYECYTKIDINQDGILEDLIITLCDDTILRIEENFMGRHPFFDIAPTKDPHRIWAKRSYAELIGELQDLKVALIRQLQNNISLTNDPKLILSEEAINIDDYVKGRQVIRKKGSYSMADSVLAMPITPLHPWTFQFLEYVEGQKEVRTGVTRYNQGLDSNTLNKMLDINTPVPMVDGTYTLLQYIKDGDRIIGSNGQPTTVLRAHEIQMPERAYRIKFQSGEDIVAGGEHLWTVQTQHDRSKKRKRTINTDELFALKNKYKRNIYIPRVQRPEFENKEELPLDPYVLGLWLGDGHSYSPPRITTQDEEVVQYIENWTKELGGEIKKEKCQNAGKATTYAINGVHLYNTLRQLGLMKNNDRPNNGECKHIPGIYLRASYSQRLELLRGLMDTDGCHHSNALTIFTQKEGQLFNDTVKLIESLGGWPTINVTNPGKLAKDGVTYYNVTFSLCDNPFKIRTKADKWRKSKRCQDHQKIVSIEQVDIRPMRCLTVDAVDGLFCVGKRFTVTHNTAHGIAAIMNASNQRLELIARMFAETGVIELYRFIVSLNQKFIDQPTVIRLTNRPLIIHPDDIRGDFDLDISAGVGITTREATMSNLQTLMTAIMNVTKMGVQVITPGNVYNIFKVWAKEAGLKDVGLFLTDPAVIQQRAIAESQVKMQVLSKLPPAIQEIYITKGFLPPEVLLMLPPEAQLLFGGNYGISTESIGRGPQQQPGENPAATAGTGSILGAESGGVPGGMVGEVPRMDNRLTQNLPGI